MMGVIALALVETLTKFMFSKMLCSLDASSTVEIDGAPRWYMQEVDDKMCSFSYARGGLDSVDVAKKKAKFKIQKDINGLINIVVYENIKNISNDKEQAVVDRFKNDKNLPVFTSANLRYDKIVYQEDMDTTFVRACIPKQTIINYQKDRLQTISKGLSISRADQALEDLDKEFE